MIAGKIAICAKVDYFGGEFIGDVVSKEIEYKIKEIERKYPKPPKKFKGNRIKPKSKKKTTKRRKPNA